MKYAFQEFNKETMAKAYGKDLGISTKHSVEICKYLKGKSVEKAKKILEEVDKKPIPFTRFNRDRGHKPGIGPGRYPIKASGEILEILKNAEANATQKGLSNLFIIHMCGHRAARPWHHGRKRRQKTKATHIEIVLGPKIKKQEAKDKK
jgi:large subunit ribosomal protein L22